MAVLIPRALPFSPGGNTEVKIATPVPNNIALPIPCKTLKLMNKVVEVEIARRKEERGNIAVPEINIFFLPCMSANLPKRMSSIAEVKR